MALGLGLALVACGGEEPIPEEESAERTTAAQNCAQEAEYAVSLACIEYFPLNQVCHDAHQGWSISSLNGYVDLSNCNNVHGLSSDYKAQGLLGKSVYNNAYVRGFFRRGDLWMTPD